MSLKLRILCILIIAIIGAQAFPQQQQQRQRQQRRRDSESPDFNFDGRVGGEKLHRSLDQVQYQDGGVRGRSSFTDSYGNPVAYDTLDDIDAQKPSKNKDNPFEYVIPGYASGILQPHEVPTRSDSGTEGRRIDDDRIHFVDPLNANSFQSFNKVPATPSVSLTAPGIDAVSNFNSPIDIPKPNIDLPETPETPTIDDPIDHVPPHPPQDVFSTPNLNPPPSTTLELPIHQDSNANPLSQNLIPPSVPSTIGVEIPRPNLDAPETPIDNGSNSPLNQGLLPPNPDFNAPAFSNPSSNDGPVIITDDQIKFAPKPSNGLLPPKESGVNDIIDYQSVPSPLPTSLNNDIPQFTGTLTNNLPTTRKQFTAFPAQPTPPSTSFQIPVQVIQSPPNQPNFIQPSKPTGTSKVTNKYQGTFGGSPGILTSDNQGDRIVPTQAANLPLSPSTSDKLNFGASSLSPLPPTSPTFTQTLPKKELSAEKKYTGNFGGPPGILTPNA